ncbi:MAG: metalloregulator ArsR/SmtB family transcription factor [Alphaproteobacteria bacterium]|nr:metalloregulator ArsR/SmtB family transcription factor [Alphaproteobacteria bacterium]
MLRLGDLDIEQFEQKAAQAGTLLKALSNPKRLMIMCRLAMGEQSVGALERQVGLGQSSLSQHLAVLRRNELVATRRDSRTIYYRLASAEAEAIMLVLYDLFCQETGVRSGRPLAV